MVLNSFCDKTLQLHLYFTIDVYVSVTPANDFTEFKLSIGNEDDDDDDDGSDGHQEVIIPDTITDSLGLTGDTT